MQKAYRLAARLQKKEKVVNSLTLKLIAWACILCGAIGTVFFSGEESFKARGFLVYISYVALPICSFLLVEGVRNTSDFKKYLLTMLGAAVISEPFYDFAQSGSWLNFEYQNPMFSLAVCLVMVYFLDMPSKNRAAAIITKGVVIVATLLWTVILRLEHGWYLTVVTALFFLIPQRKIIRNIIIAVFSLLVLATPEVALLPISKYKGQRGGYNKFIFYGLYPAMWLILVVIKSLL